MTDEEFRNYLCVYLQIAGSMLVGKGDTIIVDYIIGQRTTLYRIHATRLGPILGKKGRLINAIRTIAIAAGHKRRIRFAIDLVEYYGTDAAVPGDLLTANCEQIKPGSKKKYGSRDNFTKIWDVEPDFRNQGQYPKLASMNEIEFQKHMFIYLQISCALLADDGDTVFIDYMADKNTILYRVRASNIGLILGKKGRLITAIRDIANAAGRYYWMHIEIEVDKFDEALPKIA